MNINSKEIEPFKNLSQLEIGSIYYDFHNDFNCIKIVFEDSFLILLFKNIVDEYIVSFKFEKVILERFEFFNFEALNNLTIDNLYRVRFQAESELLEFDNTGKSYFYIEFCEEVKIELWCQAITIEDINLYGK